MNFLAILKLVISLLPTIIEAIKTIEAALSQSGAGAEKLSLLKTILQSAYNTSNDSMIQFDKVWPVIQSSVGGIVTVFNNLKLFNTAKRATDPAPAQPALAAPIEDLNPPAPPAS